MAQKRSRVRKTPAAGGRHPTRLEREGAERLARVEQDVQENRTELEIQFRRIAQIQADVDRMRAALMRLQQGGRGRRG